MIHTALNSKKIIVTGASSGIGEQLCKKIAENGGIPIMLARSEDKLLAIQMDLKLELQTESYIYKVDLQDNDDIDFTIQTILAEHEQIHGLINNAGIGVFDAVEDMKWLDLHEMFQLNVFSLMRITQLLIPHFNQYKQGHIINVASQAGKISTPKSAAYGASKHAVIGFTNTLRQEMDSKGIYVTAVNLGPVRTNFLKWLIRAEATGRVWIVICLILIKLLIPLFVIYLQRSGKLTCLSGWKQEVFLSIISWPYGETLA